MYSERYQQHIKTLVEKIEQADAIVVGGASGMSAAGGYNWYEDHAAFREHFGDFAIKYGIDSIFGGFYYRFQTLEERWAYLARLVNFVSQAPMAKPYENLFELDLKRIFPKLKLIIVLKGINFSSFVFKL